MFTFDSARTFSVAAILAMMQSFLAIAAVPAKQDNSGFQNKMILDAEVQGKRYLMAMLAKGDGGPMIHVVATPRDATDGSDALFRKVVESLLANGYRWVTQASDEKSLHASIRCQVQLTSVALRTGISLILEVRCDPKKLPEGGSNIRTMRIVQVKAGLLDVKSATDLIPNLISEAFGEAVRMMP